MRSGIRGWGWGWGWEALTVASLWDDGKQLESLGHHQSLTHAWGQSDPEGDPEGCGSELQS